MIDFYTAFAVSGDPRRQGEVVVLIGPSGCGKSTLVRCVHLLEEPTSGAIRVGTQQINLGSSGKALTGRKRAAYRHGVPAFRAVLEHDRAAERHGGSGHGQTPGRRAAADLTRGLLAKIGLAGKEQSYPAELSGEQAQRVAIARALAMSPEVMLFDEVTSALDPELVGEVLAVMRQLGEDATAMIVVTHEIAFAPTSPTMFYSWTPERLPSTGRADELLVRPQNPRTRAFLSRWGGAIRRLINRHRRIVRGGGTDDDVVITLSRGP